MRDGGGLSGRLLSSGQRPVVDVTGDGSKVMLSRQYCIGPWNVSAMNQGKLEVSNRRWQE